MPHQSLDVSTTRQPVPPEPVTSEAAVPEPVITSEPATATPEAPATAAPKTEAPKTEAPKTAAAPKAEKITEPASAKSSLPTLPTTYFGGPSDQSRAVKGFWRGSPAEILFATFTAFALIAAIILAVVGIPAPTGATGTGDTQSSMDSSTGSNSQPAVSVPAHKTYDASAPAAPQGNVVNVKLSVEETLVSIGPGAAYRAWTFNGTVPGPIIRVRQGQTVNFTLVNNTKMDHSIDFHAAETPWNVNYQAVGAGKSFSFTWKANYPGVFMYHCGTPPVIQHIANGMYGAIIVDPASGWAPAKEYVLVQSEFYTQKMSDGSLSFNYNKSMAAQPDYVTFNGYANQYKDAPLTAQLGQRVRIFLVNAGPSEFSAFHVIGAIFADTYADGNPANRMVGNQTVTIPPGGGTVVELTIPAAGQYPFVTHSFANASAGALGVLDIKP